jgi:hypothetical protein
MKYIKKVQVVDAILLTAYNEATVASWVMNRIPSRVECKSFSDQFKIATAGWSVTVRHDEYIVIDTNNYVSVWPNGLFNRTFEVIECTTTANCTPSLQFNGLASMCLLSNAG